MASKQVSLVDIRQFGIKNLKIFEIVSMYVVMLKIGNFRYKMTLKWAKLKDNIKKIDFFGAFIMAWAK